MLTFNKNILSTLISIIILLSGSGFSTLKTVCLCSGDVTVSIFDKEVCEKPKEAKNTLVIDHKCCNYLETTVKLDATTINFAGDFFAQKFNTFSFPVFFLYYKTAPLIFGNFYIKRFTYLVHFCLKKAFIQFENFRI